MKNIFTYIVFLLFISAGAFAQKTTIKGKITDAETQKPLIGVSVAIKGKVAGTITNADGNFELSTTVPATLVISMVGYERQEVAVTNETSLNIALKTGAEDLNQVVVSASRIEENILRSPVSIEKMDARTIQQSGSANFYDALLNMKGLDMVTSSLTYKQINTRGFNTTGNSRFLQLVDGVDNQSAGLGFTMGNLFGPHDIDVESVELIPGAASALYGPIAF